MDNAALPLAAWTNFYVIAGSAAGALTGLQFVVIALINSSRARTTGHEIAAWGTPTVVHFCAALFLSATYSAPWRGLFAPGLLVAGCGVFGAGYAIAVARRARHSTQYTPVFEDWLFHVGLPFLAYATLVGAGFALARTRIPASYPIAAATMLLIYVGIHNAWDTVVFLTVRLKKDE